MSCRTITPAGTLRQIVAATSDPIVSVSVAPVPTITVGGAGLLIECQNETRTIAASEPPAPTISAQKEGIVIATGSQNIPAFTVLNPGIQIAVAAPASKVISAVNINRTFTLDQCANQPIMFTISGKVIWEGNRLTTQSGVGLVVVTLTGEETQTMTTGSDGLFSFDVTNNGNYNISCYKSIAMPNAINGVTSGDSTRIQQHILGAFPLTDPYKLIAADVNSGGSITSQDISLITQAIIGNPIAQNVFIANTWKFVPQSYTFPNPLIPFPYTTILSLSDLSANSTGNNFIGVKLGDVNASANPAI